MRRLSRAAVATSAPFCFAGRKQGRLIDLGLPLGAEPTARREQLPKAHGWACEVPIAKGSDALRRLQEQSRQVPLIVGELDAAQSAVEQRTQEGLVVPDVVEADPLPGDGA